MARLANQRFCVHVFPTSSPHPYASQEIQTLTDLGAVALVMQKCGLKTVVKACVVDEEKQVVVFFGVRFVGVSVFYEHRVLV